MRLGIPLLILFAAGCASLGPDAREPSMQGHIAAIAPDREGGASDASLKGAVTMGPHATKLPEVALVTFDAAPARLDATAAGRPALVSFWATWCDSCAAEMDALNRLDERAKKSGGAVIGVAVGEAREKVAAFAKRRGLTYPQLVDEEFKLADALGQKKVPATMVLDREGRIVFVGGALDEAALAAFRAALGSK